MKAIVYTNYGPPDVLQLHEVEKPTPKGNEVLIRIQATSATLYDCWQRSSTAPTGFWLMSRMSSGLRTPKQPVLGTELAGEIEAVGKEVKQFKQGDQVFASTAESLGAYAEYKCMAESEALAQKPANMSYTEAAVVPQGGLTALYFLRKGNIHRGQKVLIYGASGGVGTYAVQLAKHFGAEVTGVCSTSKIGLVKSLGADEVVDYTQEDFSKRGESYDLILDTIGKSSISGCNRSLREGGCLIFVTFGLPKVVSMQWLKMRSSKKVIIGLLEERAEDLIFLKELIEAGEIKSVVDRFYPLEQAAEAHRYVESGQKKGQVAIKVAQQDE